jgi:mannose-6-phosphate isomerase-like protein (cupin superfamily)
MPVHNRERDVPKQPGPGHVGAMILDKAQGCVKGFCMGVAVYDTREFAKPGVHEDQEGFYVVSGRGVARVGQEEFPIEPGTFFLAAKGVPHAIRRTGDEPVKVIYAHGAV